jgi:tyrosine-protein phosphatase YwqE
MKWLRKWFGGRSSRAEAQEKGGVSLPFEVDMHAHLLPALDDGVKSREEALGLLRQMEAAGYRKAIATPHIMGDYYKNTAENIGEALAQLQQAAREEGLQIALGAAAEYYLDEWFEGKLREGRLLTFGGAYLLVETSYINEPHNLQQMLFALQTEGYRPVLAHPERYSYMHGIPKAYERLREAGVGFQINLPSVVGYYGKDVKKTVDFLIERGWVDFVGTDMHGRRHWEACLQAPRSRAYRKLISLPLQNQALLSAGPEVSLNAGSFSPL